jgi:hypothetical protein
MCLTATFVLSDPAGLTQPFSTAERRSQARRWTARIPCSPSPGHHRLHLFIVYVSDGDLRLVRPSRTNPEIKQALLSGVLPSRAISVGVQE